MKICMISYDMQDFGGLEEYAVNLAIGLKQKEHEVSYLSPAWVSPENQYFRRLKASCIPLVQPPRWISKAASNWPTKIKILRVVMLLFSPLAILLSVGLSVFKRQPLLQAWQSAYNWLKGRLMDHFIGPDYRQWLGRILLNWWTFCWHPDVLHVHGFSASLMFVIEWADGKKIPVVYEEHATPDSRFDLWKDLRQSINKAAKVIAVSEKSAEALKKICGVLEPIVVKGPLLSDPFESGWQDLNAHPPEHSSITITTIARLFPMKGLEYLLEAAVLVKATQPKARFKVYGEGELREALKARAKELGLDGEEIFVGTFTNHEELSHIMAGTDIFVLSSVLEGQPVVIVEAMAYGRPIIATAVGGVPELIQDGINGLLCAPADAHCLAQKIRILIEDPALRARLGAAARASYEQGPFQIQNVSAQFVSIYEDALRGKR